MADVRSIEQLSKMAEALKKADVHSRSVESIQAEIFEFIRGYSAKAISRTSGQMWFRARLCDTAKGYSSLHQMIYPSSGSDSFGRAHIPGSSVLYASWNMPTALDEIHAKPGDYVQIINLRPVKGANIPCHIVGEYQKFHSAGSSLINSGTMINALAYEQANNPDEFFRSVFIDSVVSELFRFPVEESLEYKITAAYSDLLHKNKGGLMYSSVKSFGAINLAVPAEIFDTEFEVVQTIVVRIKEAFGYGLYTSTPLRSSCDFHESGVIKWDSNLKRNFQYTPQAGLRGHEELAGWRKCIPSQKSS